MSGFSVCRLCFASRTQCVALKEKKTTEMLEALTAMKIASLEKISTFVCLTCFTDLKFAYDIRQKFLAVETEHQGVLLADFLMENHNDLVQLVQQNPNKFQINASGETTPKKHTNVNDFSIKHTCGICSETFQLLYDFIGHLRQHMDAQSERKPEISCEHCQEIFTDMKKHDEHKTTVHSKKCMCDICSEKFSSGDALNQHLRTAHSDLKQFSCDICNQRFSLRYVLQAHKVQHKKCGPFVCEVCGREFKYEKLFKIHKNTIHSDKKIEE